MTPELTVTSSMIMPHLKIMNLFNPFRWKDSATVLQPLLLATVQFVCIPNMAVNPPPFFSLTFSIFPSLAPTSSAAHSLLHKALSWYLASGISSWPTITYSSLMASLKKACIPKHHANSACTYPSFPNHPYYRYSWHHPGRFLHRLMGHIGVKGLRSAVEGISFDDSTCDSCTICAKANIKCSPFPSKASHRATQLLERIHCDICRPLPSSYSSFHYFILFICCHSRFIFVSLLKTRDEAYQNFVNFHSVSQNFSGQRIKILRVDNAPELIKGKLESYCKTASITYKKTVPDSPSQNNLAERSNLTLASMARP